MNYLGLTSHALNSDSLYDSEIYWTLCISLDAYGFLSPSASSVFAFIINPQSINCTWILTLKQKCRNYKSMSPPHLLYSPLIINNCANAPHSGRNFIISVQALPLPPHLKLLSMPNFKNHSSPTAYLSHPGLRIMGSNPCLSLPNKFDWTPAWCF